jgi:hypothetical protein
MMDKRKRIPWHIIVAIADIIIGSAMLVYFGDSLCQLNVLSKRK